MAQGLLKRIASGPVNSRLIRKIKPAKYIKENVHFLQDLYYDSKTLADSITLENITSCDRECPYCPHFWEERKSHLMPESIYRKIIDDLVDLGYAGTIIFAPWSEPLLDDRLTELIKYAKDHLPKCKVNLQTNGDLLTPKKFQMLRSAGVDMIDVSYHYSIRDDRYMIHKPIQAIKTYLQIGEDERKILHFHDTNFRKIRGLERFHNRSGLVPLKECLSLENLQNRCSFPEEIVAVNYKGDVLLCARQWIESPSFGNTANEHIKTIWEKNEFAKERKALRKGIFNLELCKNCGCGYALEPKEVMEMKASPSAKSRG